MGGMLCVNCKKVKKNIHLCEFKGMKIICDECCKVLQSNKECKNRGCGLFQVDSKG